MSLALYNNNAESISIGSILTTATAITVATGDGAKFPVLAGSSYSVVTLTDGTAFEIVRVTAIVGDVLTITRAQEGTAALSWASGTTVSQRLTAGLLASLIDGEGAGLNSVQVGFGSTSSGSYGVSVGQSCSASGFVGLAIGAWATAQNSYTIAIGNNNSATGLDAIAIGRSINVSATNALGIGRASNVSGVGAIAIGEAINATGQDVVAIGSNNSATGLQAICIGKQGSASATYSLAMGRLAFATATRAIAIGERANNTIADTTVIRCPIMVKKHKYAGVPNIDYSGAEVVFMTSEQNLTAIGNTVSVAIPPGAIFIPSSAGILVTASNGIITTQPTVEVSWSLDNITYTPLTPAALTTGLTASRKFQNLAIGAQTSAALFLRGGVTVPAVSTLTYTGRYYFKGILVQE